MYDAYGTFLYMEKTMWLRKETEMDLKNKLRERDLKGSVDGK